MATGKERVPLAEKLLAEKRISGRKKNDIQQESFTEEVILWVILAISILLFISNFGIGWGNWKCCQQFLFWRIWFNCIYFSNCFGDWYFFCSIQ